jgi:hypothetical protein
MVFNAGEWQAELDKQFLGYYSALPVQGDGVNVAVS